MKKYLLVALLGLLSTDLIAQDGPKAEKKDIKKDKKEYKMDKKAEHGNEYKAQKKKMKADKKGYREEVKEVKNK